MKNITTTVYEFDELSDAAKENARDWYKEGYDFPLLEESMQEKLADLLAENGIKDDNGGVKCFYSLGYSQGDGAMFCGTVTWNGRETVIKHSGHYYHEYSKEIDMPDASEREYAEFEKVYVSICIKLARYGYEHIEYARSNESVDDNIRANEYTFTSDGKRFG